MDDDARACYDRIVTPLSAVEGCHWGMSFSEAVYTRTATGVSTDSYGFSTDTQTQGGGQGMGWAGHKWLNTVDTCSRVLNNTYTGMKYEDPYREIKICKVAYYFVDDTATGVSDDAIQDNHDVLYHLNNTEQKHAHVLFAVDHKHTLDKRSYYLVDFKRSGTHHKYKLISEYDGILDKIIKLYLTWRTT